MSGKCAIKRYAGAICAQHPQIHERRAGHISALALFNQRLRPANLPQGRRPSTTPGVNMALRQTMLAAAILIALLSTADARPRHHHYRVDANGSPATIVSHPAGCLWRAFCGCGVSIHVFGHSVRELWLARAWFKFPRSSPAPGMVAVRSHHVMALESHVSGNIWIVYDPNSGGHATRVHARSISGFVIVNPRSHMAGL